MAKPLFSEIFGMYLGDELNSVVAECLLERCELDMENRSVEAVIRSDYYIDKETQHKIMELTKKALKLNTCEMHFWFAESCFCAAACSDIAAELKIKNAALNGYFGGADYNIEGDTVKITLKHGGYKKICETDFVKQFTYINTFNLHNTPLI